MTNARGIDVSEHNPWVTRDLLVEWKMRYPGMCYGYRRTYIGSRRDPYGPEHLTRMQAAGYMTGPYGVPFETGPLENQPLTEQCRRFIASRDAADSLPNWVDVERTGLTEKMLEDWCDYYDDHTDVPLWVYTSQTLWHRIIKVNHSRYTKYGLVVADYGPGTLTSQRWITPEGRPLIPKPWAFRAPPYYDIFQYAGDNGRLFGSPPGKGIDLSEYNGTEADLRALVQAPAPPPVPDQSKTIVSLHAQAILEII